jgi:CBS domain containing-hemolysin-like protein
MPSITAFWTWLGIIACVPQSALFAGLNLAIFSLSQLRLQLEADGGNADAARVLELRKNSNPVLATVIWGNVSTNVLLTLLSDSVLAGLSAFFFSAIVITLLGEIIPQAYFSRNALRMTARFLPFLNFYRAALFPLAKADGDAARLVARDRRHPLSARTRGPLVGAAQRRQRGRYRAAGSHRCPKLFRP